VYPIIEQAGIRLRTFRATDWPGIIEAASDPYIVATTTVPPNCDEPGARDFIERQLRRLPEGTGYSFAIASRADDTLVGQIGVWLEDRDQGRVTLGYWIIPSARGKGIASTALRMATDFAWTLDGLVGLELHIEPDNHASIRTAERCGYVREGLLRAHKLIGTQWRDVLCYSAAPSPTGQETTPSLR